MVVFDEPLQPGTVQASDFTVTGAAGPLTINQAVYHSYQWGYDEHAYGLVFLSLATPLATDATPTVALVGAVVD
jgi:hypothetical protein